MAELAAICLALPAVRALFGLEAVRRLQRFTGADYLLGPAGQVPADLKTVSGSRVSGVDCGDPRRLRVVGYVRNCCSWRVIFTNYPGLALVVGLKARTILIKGMLAEMSWAEFHGASEVHAIAADEASCAEIPLRRASRLRVRLRRRSERWPASMLQRTRAPLGIRPSVRWRCGITPGSSSTRAARGVCCVNVPALPRFARDEIDEMLAAIARERGWWVARLL